MAQTADQSTATTNEMPHVGNGADRTLTRRALLRRMAAGTAAGTALAAAGPPLSAQTPEPTRAPEVDVTFQTNGWPFDVPPPADARQSDASAAGYGAAIDSWLELNPGVTFELTNVDQWDQQAMITALSGGTAPAWFQGAVIGGYDTAATFAGFKQGLAADITDRLQGIGLDGKIADYVKPPWANWQLDGRAYCAPESLIAGNGIYFRRDLITAAGMEEPRPGWTWEDFRAIAKGLTEGNRKGAAMQQWGIGWVTNAQGYDLLTRLPDPEQPWHWRVDLTSRGDEWARWVQFYRDMVFTDKSILSDIAFDDGTVAESMVRGDVGMFGNNSLFFTAEPASPRSMIRIAESVDKPLDDVVGWIQHPVGATEIATNTQPFVQLLSFSPDLDDEALDKAISLYDYMYFGPGYTIRRQAAYEASKDIRLVFGDVNPVNGMTEIPGIPGNADEAWGTKYMDAVRAAVALPLVPQEAQFIPAEENPGPTGTAAADVQSRFAYEPGTIDIAADLAQLQETLNSQYAGFSSSVSREDFIAGAQAYYQAHDAFWQQHAPEFYATTFKPWYDENIAPALGG